MPELTIHRLHPEKTPPRMVCMYCGAEAAHKQERRVEHPRTDPPPGRGAAGNDLSPVPSGDDPVSAVVGILMLPFALWELLKGLGQLIAAAARFHRTRREEQVAPKPPPPLNPPATLVTITTCDRHRRFTLRFVWAGLGMLMLLAMLWVVAVRRVMAEFGTDDTGGFGAGLLVLALMSTVALPIALSLWYTLAGPVIVDRVTRDTVVLDRVRPAYFTAVGIDP